jgi:hypothetical protein
LTHLETRAPEPDYRPEGMEVPRRDGVVDQPGYKDNLYRGVSKAKWFLGGLIAGVASTVIGFIIAIVQVGQQIVQFFTGLF